MNRRPRVCVIIGTNFAYIRGHRARQLLMDCGGRPVWGGITKAWATTPTTAADAVALAESRGWWVTVERREKAIITSAITSDGSSAEVEERGLW